MIGGKTQTKPSTYTAKNIGKKNVVSAEKSAEAEVTKIVKKKVNEGYVITESLTELPTFSDPFDFDLDNIPVEFCCSKPIKEITEAQIDEVISSGSARFFVKYNGGCHYIHVNSTGKVFIYTRRWNDYTSKYPKIVEFVKAKRFPVNTLMIAELCIDPSLDLDHMRAFKLFAEISKTDTLNGDCKSSQEASWALQEQHPVRAAVFGYLYYGGEQVWHLPYQETVAQLAIDVWPLSNGNPIFFPQEVSSIESATEIIELAEEHRSKVEGFILWDTRKVMEVSMTGKPKRRASWKIKLRGEMDVVAIAGIEGKVPGKYGSIQICLADKNMEQVDMGAVSGLKDAEKEPDFWDFPCVIEVTFDNRFPDTGLLQFGKFSKVHEDKTPDEVDLFSLD